MGEQNETDEQQSQDDVKQQARHDPFFRSTFSEPALFRKWLVWFLPVVSKLLDLDRLELQNDSLIDEKLKVHYNDLLYKIPIRGTDKNMVVFILLEHKAASERWTMLQILRYIVLIWMREINAAIEQNRFAGFVLPPVLPIILYHGERPFTAPIRFSELVYQFKGFEKHSPDFEGMLFDLTLTAESDLPEDLDLYAVLTVMQAVFRPDVAERILRIYTKLKHKLGDPHYRDRWLKILRYAMTSSKYLSPKNINRPVRKPQNEPAYFIKKQCFWENEQGFWQFPNKSIIKQIGLLSPKKIIVQLSFAMLKLEHFEASVRAITFVDR